MELNTGFPGAIDAIALGSNHMCQSTDGFGVYQTLETHGCYNMAFFSMFMLCISAKTCRMEVPKSWRFGRFIYCFTPWKINGWSLQPSPIFRKEHDLNQTSMRRWLSAVKIFRGVPNILRAGSFSGPRV